MFKKSTPRHVGQDIFYIFHRGKPIRFRCLYQCIDSCTGFRPFRTAGEQPVLSADSNSVLLLGGAGKEVGEDGTGNVMPHREHSAGDGCQRILCKVGGSQRGGQTGVLHSDLDGNCTALGGIQLQQLTNAKAGEP